MNMILTVGLLVYGVCAVVCARLVAGHWAYTHTWQEGKRTYDNGEYVLQDGTRPPAWLGGAGMGLAAGLLLPLTLLVLAPGLNAGAERRAKREKALRVREERIRIAERELGLTQ